MVTSNWIGFDYVREIEAAEAAYNVYRAATKGPSWYAISIVQRGVWIEAVRQAAAWPANRQIEAGDLVEAVRHEGSGASLVGRQFRVERIEPGARPIAVCLRSHDEPRKLHIDTLVRVETDASGFTAPRTSAVRADVESPR